MGKSENVQNGKYENAILRLAFEKMVFKPRISCTSIYNANIPDDSNNNNFIVVIFIIYLFIYLLLYNYYCYYCYYCSHYNENLLSANSIKMIKCAFLM